MILAIFPPHSGHDSGGGSLTFCNLSTILPHLSQTNS